MEVKYLLDGEEVEQELFWQFVDQSDREVEIVATVEE